LSEIQKGLLNGEVMNETPQGFTRFGSNCMASPSMSETKFVWTYTLGSLADTKSDSNSVEPLSMTASSLQRPGDRAAFITLVRSSLFDGDWEWRRCKKVRLEKRILARLYAPLAPERAGWFRPTVRT
jgi:hypothetical protein